MMGHSVDENVRLKTTNECSCEENWGQNISQEEQTQELWSSNSIIDNDSQVL